MDARESAYRLEVIINIIKCQHSSLHQMKGECLRLSIVVSYKLGAKLGQFQIVFQIWVFYTHLCFLTVSVSYNFLYPSVLFLFRFYRMVMLCPLQRCSCIGHKQWQSEKFWLGGGRKFIHLHYNKSFINFKNMISFLSFKELNSLGIDIIHMQKYQIKSATFQKCW